MPQAEALGCTIGENRAPKDGSPGQTQRKKDDATSFGSPGQTQRKKDDATSRGKRSGSADTRAPARLSLHQRHPSFLGVFMYRILISPDLRDSAVRNHCVVAFR